jgi:hypothetical protein
MAQNLDFDNLRLAFFGGFLWLALTVKENRSGRLRRLATSCPPTLLVRHYRISACERLQQGRSAKILA